MCEENTSSGFMIMCVPVNFRQIILFGNYWNIFMNLNSLIVFQEIATELKMVKYAFQIYYCT